jgi:uncharacterized protein
MPRWLITAILTFLERRISDGLTRLELEFFGGEPLAAWDVLAEIGEQAFRLCTASGTQLVGGITTNATQLTEQRLDFMVRCGVSNFQITLDGPSQIHDQRRVTESGKGTFAKIWTALKLVKSTDHEVNVIIRLHFDPSTFSELAGESGFVSEVVREFVRDDKRFLLMLQPLTRLGGAHDDDILVFPRGSQKIAFQTLLANAINAGAQTEQLPQFTNGSLGEAGLEICYAARANAFVVRPNGEIAKCTVAFEDKRNKIGRLSPEGDLLIDHQRHLPWLRGLMSGDPLQLSCPAMHVIWSHEEQIDKSEVAVV